MKLSVCIDAVFKQTPVLDALKTIKGAGIPAFEFWGWWNKDLAEIKSAKAETGLALSAFCTRSSGLTDASKRTEYLDGLKESIEKAHELDCATLITQVGGELKDVPRETQHRNIVDGLKACVPFLEDANVCLVIEPLNTLVDHKGYYLYSSDEAFRMIDEVGSGNVRVLYDVYHQQIMEGHLISRITANIDKIGHFHSAGNPGRHETTVGEINYPAVVAAIRDSGYRGYFGLEYRPTKEPAAGLREIVASLG